jgi:hypothetical protein
MKKETEMEKKKKIMINIKKNEIIREIQIHTGVRLRIWAPFKWQSFARYNKQDSEKNKNKNKTKNWPRHQSRAKVTKN